MNLSFILPTKTPTNHDFAPMSKIIKDLNASSTRYNLYINKVDSSITHYFTWNVGKKLYEIAKKKFPNAIFINLVWDIPQWRIEGKDDYGKAYNWDSYYRPFLKNADILLAASKNTKMIIKKYYKLNSRLFYMFFDDKSLLRKSIFDLLPKLKKDSIFTIIGISRLVPSKKFDVLIKSISILKKKYSLDIKLLLVGGGPEKIFLRKLAIQKEINIKFYTNISKARLVYLLKNSDLLVAPSILEGDCGWAPCEAIFSNIPTIVSDINVTKEFLKDGSIYFKQNDHIDLSRKIKKFFNKKIKKNELIKKGKKNLQFYKIDSFKKRLKLFIEELL